ncbi:MAG: CHAP domain-containing protein [Planctomycetota bacterium]|nr:CHAP domain-containing protein [Planctomycetota bacterium]
MSIVTYDVDAAVRRLIAHAQPKSTGRCAEFVRRAIEAGGIILHRTGSAKDYGPSLRAAGFEPVASYGPFLKGDVVIIDGFFRQSTAHGQVLHDHKHGHMAMYDGWRWISDFAQRNHTAPGYPGNEYDLARPHFTVYRYISSSSSARLF